MKCCQCVTLDEDMRIIKITLLGKSVLEFDKAVSLHLHQAVILIVVKSDFQISTFVY